METSAPCSCGPAFDEGPVQAYNEAAFRYLLETERHRAKRASRTIVLLLVSLRGNGGPVAPAAAARLFSGLSASVREVDFIGWYRDQHVAGAVLTQHSDAPSPDACREIRQRVTRVLAGHLPSPLLGNLRVRVVQLNATRQS